MTTDNRVISLIHADDHPITRKGVEFALSNFRKYRLLQSVDNGRKALQAIETHSPDIALLDVEMPELGGLEVVMRVLEQKLPTKIVLLTSFLDNRIVSQGQMLSVRGFLSKESTFDEIHQCIAEVMDGNTYISPVYYSFFKIEQPQKTENPLKSLLSKTEFEVLKLIAQNMTTSEIAEKMESSPRTIDTHRYNICKKLNINGSHGLLSYALANKEYF